MRILGLDPGLNRTGYGILEGASLEVVAFGVITVPRQSLLPSKLEAIYTGLQEKIREYDPEVAACETVFYGKSAKTALLMGHARGVILLAAKRYGLTVFEYSPAEVKRAVVGRGRASKEQVRFMVGNILGLKESPRDVDASDALAVAICHLFRAESRL